MYLTLNIKTKQILPRNLAVANRSSVSCAVCTQIFKKLRHVYGCHMQSPAAKVNYYYYYYY